MKYAKIPPTIRVIAPVNGQPGTNQDGTPALMSFRDFAILFWLNDARWHRYMASLVRVRPEFDHPEGSVIRFEDNDYAPLRAIVASPDTQQSGYPLPLFVLQMQSFPKAILEASSEDPSVSGPLDPATVIRP